MKMAVLLFLAAAAMAAAPPAYDGPQYAADGRLILPPDYRQWIFLSSGLGMTYGTGSHAPENPPFENVFVNPSSYRAFQATGQWPEKTMFVLEIRRAAEKGSINVAGRFQTDIVSIEASVKDSSHFPQTWAYIDFGHSERGNAFPRDSRCNTCHGENAAVEHTFVQFYPTLLETATRKGTLNPSYRQKQTGTP
jgi:hypothetical protein